MEVCSLEQNQDCVVTEYSNWTICCGGTQRRTRSIVIEQKNNGAKCPPVKFVLNYINNKVCLDLIIVNKIF